MKTLICGTLSVVLAAPAVAQDYPTKDIQGIIRWGAGGTG